MPRLFPSLIAAHPLDLRTTIHALEPFCDGFHIDVMDNHFVPNLIGSVDLIKSIAQETSKTLWVHLMIDKPEDFIPKLKLPPKSIISFHIENNADYSKIINLIHAHQWLASITINPTTSIEQIFDALPLVDHILIMSVKPGFSGQIFIPETIHRLDQLHNHMKSNDITLPVGIDGGITQELLAPLVAKQVTDFVMGHALFGKKDPVATCKDIHQYLQAL